MQFHIKPLAVAAVSEVVHLLARSNGRTIPGMRLYALVETGHRQAIDVYLREEDARRERGEILGDEPQWTGLLRVEQIELDHEHTSLN
jgi:hypothetical protein